MPNRYQVREYGEHTFAVFDTRWQVWVKKGNPGVVVEFDTREEAADYSWKLPQW